MVHVCSEACVPWGACAAHDRAVVHMLGKDPEKHVLSFVKHYPRVDPEYLTDFEDTLIEILVERGGTESVGTDHVGGCARHLVRGRVRYRHLG